MAMDLDTIPNFLSELRENAPGELQHYFLNFEDYWERKLWHELTNELQEYYQHPESAPQRRPLYDTFIKSFSDKINQLKLVQLGLAAAEQVLDDGERLKYLTSLASKVNKPTSQDAYVYAKVAVAGYKGRHLGDFDGEKKDLDEAEAILDTFDSVETVVHATFYEVFAHYHQAKWDYTGFYRNSLLYLACVDLDQIPQQEQQQRSYELSIAALVSDSIYNFGELLLHPILASLQNTQRSWLRDLLFAFNRGDLSAYDVLAGNLSKEPLLEQHQTFLYQKISLAALTETIFRRPPHDRAMTFDTISEETKVQPNEIEHLIMKALSLGLVRGTIDQVAQVARINWVQPKVLDMGQVGGMRARLREWDGSVNSLGTWIEGAGRDVWAA